MRLSIPTPDMMAAFGRHVISYAAGAITIGVGVHILSPDQGSSIGTALGQVVSGLTTAAGGIATLASIGAALYAAWTSTKNAQIAAVNSEDNGVKVVPNSSPTPAVMRSLK